MKIDPRTKLVIVICLSSLALVYNTPGQLLSVLAATVILLVIFNFNMAAIWGYLKPFFFLMLFLFLIQSIFSPGKEVLLAVGSVPLITAEGITAGASVVLRIIVVIAAAMLLTTFSSRDFILSLVQCKIPYELAFMVSISLRFLPILKDELINVVTAVQLRGVELKKVPWGRKLAMYRCLVLPVVFSALLKAQQLAVAMEARGFRAYPQRTYLRQLSFYWVDYAVMLVFLTVTMMLIGQRLI